MSSDAPTHFVDVVEWADQKAARDASEVVRTEARFAPFVACIDQIVSFRHCDRQA